MKQKSRGLQVLSLALVAVAGLMAFMATGASANWFENGAEVKANKLVEVKTHVEGNLEVKEETQLEILCAVQEGEDLLLVASSNEATGKIKFKTCKTWQGGKELPNCKPAEPIVASGKVHALLDSAKTFALLEPAVVGGNFAQIKFSPPCALPETNNVKGSLVAECLTSALVAADCATEEAVHLLRANQTSLFEGDKLTYGTKAALLLGIAKTNLASGLSWSGHV
ncbi:MAG TPA: hypothetical protein VGC63_10520 [Solirubrobacterales bacterium]|jgi:hypothetical protein